MHVEGKTGFVFLSDEKDAYFVHGDVHVPVKQGALVTFQGSEEHYTVIPPGKTVQILGPFAMRDGRHLKFVVASPTSAAPSAGPTTIEDTCELCNLDFGGGKTFYTIKKEIFGICIEKCVPSVWINKFESIGFECGSCKN